MKKLNLLFITAVICVLMSSCDTGVSFNGQVVDKNTHQPIAGVRINVKDRDTTFTDSLGKYTYSRMMYGLFGDTEILLEKEGYKTKHLNLSTGKAQRKDAVIELQKSDATTANSIDRKYVKTMFYFNKYFLSLLNVLTLLFIAINKKIKYRVAWIAGILLLNLTFFFSFTDFSLIKYHILNGPIYLTHFKMYPYSLKFVIPIATILFWVLYLVKKEWIMEKIKTAEEKLVSI
jgi:hypothetical protein